MVSVLLCVIRVRVGVRVRDMIRVSVTVRVRVRARVILCGHIYTLCEVFPSNVYSTKLLLRRPRPYPKPSPLKRCSYVQR